MPFDEDRRIKVARRTLALSWVYFALFLVATMAAAAGLGTEPLLFGLPRWVTVSCVGVPAVFVAALVPVVEKLIPGISLSDEEDGAR